GFLPDNAGTAFGADDGVVGELQHADAVADADAERSAGASFADDDADDRGLDARHLKQVGRDELSLAALLGADAWIGAFGIDQADDRQLELGGQLHLVESLAIALWMSAAVHALILLLGGAPFLLANQHDAMIADACEAGADGPVVADGAVAVKFDEFVENHADVIERLRAGGMTRNENRVPGAEVMINLARQADDFPADTANLFAGIPLLACFAFQTGQDRFHL